MPAGVGYSDDYASDIAELMQLGMAGDTAAQETIMNLVQMAEKGDERVARFVDDAVSRIKENRHYPEEGVKDSRATAARLSELSGTADPSEPTEREQQLLKIIAKMARNENGSEGQGAELGAGEGSPQGSSVPQG